MTLSCKRWTCLANHGEITLALEQYVRTIITLAPDTKISIDMKAGRLESGFSAILDITPGASVQPVTRAPIDNASPERRQTIAEIPATEEAPVAQAVVRQPSGVASGTPSTDTATMGQFSTTQAASLTGPVKVAQAATTTLEKPGTTERTAASKKTGGLFAPKVVEPVAEAEPDVVELDDRALDQLEEQTDVADASDGDDGLPALGDELCLILGDAA